MAMDNKDNNSSENNQNRQFTPGDRSRAAHLSPPLAGGQANLLNPDFLSYLDEMIERSVDIQVREMLKKWSPTINLPPRLLPDSNIQARYRLQFINKVKNTTFTTDLVRDENGDPIKVAIYDTYTQSIISPDCFLSSAKVRLMVLNVEFWKNKGVNWSRSEFNQSVLREREGKGPILVGRPSLTILLENGVGTFGNIVFNDNSSWTNSWFRLGVMVEGEGEEGYLNGERVQEGVSEPFRVKGCCVKASQKPKLLKLTHNVRCIKKIGKGRASLLQKKNINTVEEFLKSLYNDVPELREILSIKSESDKEWKSIVNDATQCADEFCAKYNASNNSSQPQQVRSCWTKVGFRLGVMVEGDGESEEDYLNGEIIRKVIDRRGEASQKLDLLKLTDSVRCIKKIGNTHASLLQKKNINTVENFLWCYYNNQSELREMLCINSESGKEWESMLEHVMQCADEYHAKCNASNNSSQPRLDANVESGNILNGDSVQRTNVGGFPHDQSELLFDMLYSKYDPDIIMDGSGNPDIIMNGSGNYGGGDTGRKVTMAVAGLEGLSLEESQTAGYSGIFQENRPE